MLGSVYRIGLPRTDLKVLLDGMELKPALALGSWLAFRSEGIRRNYVLDIGSDKC
jgi:Domain of Unknown Function (DUF1259)